jgi:hypothetical protein
VALDEDGRSKFNDLMFGRREPVYVAFDVLFVDGEDVRALPLKDRKALPEKMVRRHRLQRSEPVLGEGKTAFKAVCDLDLEGIVAKRLGDAYGPRTRWWKMPPSRWLTIFQPGLTSSLSTAPEPVPSHRPLQVRHLAFSMHVEKRLAWSTVTSIWCSADFRIKLRSVSLSHSSKNVRALL